MQVSRGNDSACAIGISIKECGLCAADGEIVECRCFLLARALRECPSQLGDTCARQVCLEGAIYGKSGRGSYAGV